MKTKYFIPAAVLCGMAALGLSGCGVVEVDVSQYAAVSFSGLDGEGEAELDYDYDSLEDAVCIAMFGDDYITDIDDIEDFGTLEKVYEMEEQAEDVFDSVDVTLDVYSGLSNGDTVTVTITADEDTANENGVSFTGTGSITFTVEGLTERISLDPFDEDIFNVTEGEGVYIEFTGTSPDASLQIRNTLPSSNPLSKVTYTAETTSDISKGDEIRITAELPESYEEEGYVLGSSSTTVTCEEVDEYITSLDDIDDETWEKILAQCDDINTAQLVKSDCAYIDASGDSHSLSIYAHDDTSDFAYSNAYLLSLKDGLNTGYSTDYSYNKLIISYSITINSFSTTYYIFSTPDEEDLEDITGAVGYFTISNLIKKSDGSIEFTTDMVSLGNYIYTNEDTMVAKVINTKKDSFTVTQEEIEE